MSQATVTISDTDQSREYELEVEYDFQPAERATGPSYASGGEPGYPAHCEINSCRCTLVTTWCGVFGVSKRPADDERKSLENEIGEWCWETYADEIHQQVMQFHADKDEALRDDAAESAAERREELRCERGDE